MEGDFVEYFWIGLLELEVSLFGRAADQGVDAFLCHFVGSGGEVVVEGF